MRLFSRFISLIFHPLLIPLAGAIAYFLVSPEYHAEGEAFVVVIPIAILTLVIPLVALLILDNLGLLREHFLKHPLGELALLLLGMGMCTLVIFRILSTGFYLPLYYFFTGLTAAYTAALLALLLQVRANQYMIGLGSLLMFLVTLSIHFESNITFAISICVLACGLTASSRLYLRPQRRVGLLIGLFMGLLTQLLSLKFWL